MAQSFRDLTIWQKAYKLALKVRRLTSKYPKEEKYGLTDQTNRSSASVMGLIAESHGRYFYKDKVRVLYESRGEVEETRSHLSLAHGLDYLSNDEFKEVDLEYEELNKGISSYIRILRNGTN